MIGIECMHFTLFQIINIQQQQQQQNDIVARLRE